MQKDKLLALAAKVGFVIDKLDEQSFQFEAIGFRCVAFMYPGRQRDDIISLQLFCGFDNQPGPDLVHAWNSEMRFVKARTSPRGQLMLEMDLIVPADMTAEHLRDVWRIWNQLMARVPVVFGGAPVGVPI